MRRLESSGVDIQIAKRPKSALAILLRIPCGRLVPQAASFLSAEMVKCAKVVTAAGIQPE
jgi:hypothetical protein